MKKTALRGSNTEVLSAALVVSCSKIHKHVGAIIRISKKIASVYGGCVVSMPNGGRWPKKPPRFPRENGVVLMLIKGFDMPNLIESKFYSRC